MNEENNQTTQPTQPVEQPVTPEVTPEATPVAPETPAAPVEPTPVAPAAEPVAQPVQQPVGTPPVQPMPVQPQQPKGNSNIIFFVIVGILVFLIVVVGIVLVVLNVKKDGGTPSTPTTTEEATTEYTTRYQNTTNTVVSTTTRTYATTTYTQTTRTTRAQNDPSPVNSNSKVYKVDNYRFDLSSSSDFEVYEEKGESFIYDKVDKMQIFFNVYEGLQVEDQVANIETIANQLIGMGYSIIDTAQGNINGLNVIYYTLTDGQYYYTDLFMNTNYGDIIEVQTMSVKQYNGKSVSELAYKIIKTGVKVGTAVTSAPANNNTKFNLFDERLFN